MFQLSRYVSRQYRTEWTGQLPYTDEIAQAAQIRPRLAGLSSPVPPPAQMDLARIAQEGANAWASFKRFFGADNGEAKLQATALAESFVREFWGSRGCGRDGAFFKKLCKPGSLTLCRFLPK